MGEVQYIGLKDFTSEESSDIKKLSLRYLEKLEHHDFPSRVHLALRCKKYSREGKPKYSFHGRLDCPSLLLTSQASDWDLHRTLHKVMQKLEREFQHRFKTEGQPQEKFHPPQRVPIKKLLRR